MIAVVIVLVFVATALGVAVLMSLMIPTPNPHAIRLEHIAAARSAASVESETNVRPNRFAAWLQGVAESLGRTMPVRDVTVQSKRRMLLAQGGYRHANAVVIFQGCRLLLAAVLSGVFLLILPYLKGWDGTQQLAVILLLGAGPLCQ